MNFVVIGVLVLLVIGFLVLLWKAARDWRWYNIVGAIFTMGLAITFLFPTAGALKSRQAWHKIYEANEARAETELAENKVIQYGDPTDPTAGPGVIDLAQQLAKVGIEAGRRWRGMRMSTNAVQNIQLIKPPQNAGLPPGVAAPADPAAAAPAPAGPLAPVSLIVYGFSEAVVPGVQGAVPTFFLGEFRVTASDANGMTLTPTGPLEPEQQQRITNGQAASWSVYELLPLDAHEPFVAEGSVPSDENIYGRIDDSLVRGLLQWTQADEDRLQELKGREDAGEELPKPEQDELTFLAIRGATIQGYLRDGNRATSNDPPLSRWVKIEFTKNHTVDVDSPEQRGALDGGFFDKGTGRATDSRLRRGGDGNVKFKAGDQLIVKEEEAKRLIDVDGVARLVDTYYKRPLNNYRFILRRIRLRLTEMALRDKELDQEEKVLNAALAATVAMLTDNQTEKQMLEQDLAQTQAEGKAIKSYHDGLQKDLNSTRQTLTLLYQRNVALEKQLRESQSAVLNAAK